MLEAPIDLVESLYVKVDSGMLLKEYLRLAMDTILNSRKSPEAKKLIGIKVLVPEEKEESLAGLPDGISALLESSPRLPIFLISGWFVREDGKENERFLNFGNCPPSAVFRFENDLSPTDAALLHMEQMIEKHGEAWEAAARDKIRPGYGYGGDFQNFMGCLGWGCEIVGCDDYLVVSAVRIYYEQ